MTFIHLHQLSFTVKSSSLTNPDPGPGSSPGPDPGPCSGFDLVLVAGNPDSEEKKDSFAEKLATQVIKNLQVKVSSIHLRYEDDVSFGCGPG